MKTVIIVNEDVTLVQFKNQTQQTKTLLALFQKNKSRLQLFFPGYYSLPLSFQNIQKLLTQKEKKFNQDEEYSFAICSKKAKKIIGAIEVDCVCKDAFFSYWIDKNFENKKIISHSFDKLREILFQNHFTCLLAHCNIKNKKSITFLTHKGFTIFSHHQDNNRKKFIFMQQTKIQYQSLKKLLQSQNERI